MSLILFRCTTNLQAEVAIGEYTPSRSFEMALIFLGEDPIFVCIKQYVAYI